MDVWMETQMAAMVSVQKWRSWWRQSWNMVARHSRSSLLSAAGTWVCSAKIQVSVPTLCEIDAMENRCTIDYMIIALVEDMYSIIFILRTWSTLITLYAFKLPWSIKHIWNTVVILFDIKNILFHNYTRAHWAPRHCRYIGISPLQHHIQRHPQQLGVLD